MKQCEQWKQLPDEKRKEIIDEYHSGVKREKIIRKYKITYGQLISILRNESTVTRERNNTYKEKILPATPAAFKSHSWK